MVAGACKNGALRTLRLEAVIMSLDFLLAVFVMPTLMDVLRYPCELFCGQMLPWLSWLEREAVDLKVGISSLPGSALDTWAVCLSSATEFQDRAIAMALEGCLFLGFTKRAPPNPQSSD